MSLRTQWLNDALSVHLVRAGPHTNVFVPQSLSFDGRSGGQHGGADRRRCPVWRPLRFFADRCEAVGVSVSLGLLGNQTELAHLNFVAVG